MMLTLLGAQLGVYTYILVFVKCDDIEAKIKMCLKCNLMFSL